MNGVVIVDADGPLGQLAREARTYTRLVDSVGATALDSDSLLHDLRCALADIYRAGLALPLVAVDGEILDSDSIRSNLARIVYRRIEPNVAYLWPYLEATSQSLADDIASVYADVHPLISETGNRAPMSPWQAKLDYDTHWGPHALSALSKMHAPGVV